MQSTLYPRLLFMTATSLHPIYRTSRFTRLRAEPQDAQFTVAAPQHFLYFFPKPQGHGSFRPTLGELRHGSLVWALGLSCRCARKYRYAATSLGLTDKRRVLALQFQP